MYNVQIKRIWDVLKMVRCQDRQTTGLESLHRPHKTTPSFTLPFCRRIEDDKKQGPFIHNIKEHI